MKAACDSFIRLSIQWLVDYVFPSDEQHIMAHLQLPCYVNKIYIFMPHFCYENKRILIVPSSFVAANKQTNVNQSIRLKRIYRNSLSRLWYFVRCAAKCATVFAFLAALQSMLQFFSSCCCCIMRLIGIAIVAPASLLMDLPGCKTIASAESWKTMATPCNGYSCHIVASCCCVCACVCASMFHVVHKARSTNKACRKNANRILATIVGKIIEKLC